MSQNLIKELLGILELDHVDEMTVDLVSLNDGAFLYEIELNLKKALASKHLSPKEVALVAFSTAANERHTVLLQIFEQLSTNREATEEEIGEVLAYTSLMATNNIFFRFKHITSNEAYEKMAAQLRTKVLRNTVLPKEFSELIATTVSSINNCEACVNFHEKVLIDLGTSEARILDAVRLASVIKGLTVILQ